MRTAEIIAGLVLTAVVLYYLVNGANTSSVINSISSGSSQFVRALMGR